MPYGQIQENQLRGGILFDLAQALSQQLHMTTTFVVLPRKRIDGAALAGDIDVRCYVNPTWTSIPAHFTWSGSLFPISEILFGNTTVAPPHTLSDIPNGSSINTVLGFVYPALCPYFASGAFLRDDANDQEKVLRKTTAQHTNYGVSDVLALQWYLRTTPNHGIAPWKITVSKNDFQCAIPKNGKVPAEKVVDALRFLQKNGRLDAILRNYR